MIHRSVDKRSSEGIDHDPRTYALFNIIRYIDKNNDNICDLKFGGDGDDGDNLMYLFDIYFQEIAGEDTCNYITP